MATSVDQRFWKRVFPAGAYAVAVFVACTIPIAIPQKAGLWTDKTDHLVAFLILEILIARAFDAERSLLRRHALAVTLSAVFGAAIEGWQGLLPWRSMELLDWVADVAGALLGAVLSALICCMLQRSCKPGATA